MLMPTNCWNAASPMPTRTTGASRAVPDTSTSDRRGRCSPRRLCSTCRTRASASLSMRANTWRACSRLPLAIRKRGDSGMHKAPSSKAAAGTASIQNIQRQAGASNQKVALAPPASLARMSLLRKAPKSPSTIAICCSEARRPRIWAGATSEIYMGASTLAAPIASPPAIRAAMKRPGEPAAPVTTAEQYGRNGEARGRGPGAEGVRQGVDSPIDDTTVKTKEKAADGGHRAQRDDVGKAARGGGERRGSARGSRDALGRAVLDSSDWFMHGKLLCIEGASGTPAQKLKPLWKPSTTALVCWLVPPGRMMYCRSGWKKNASPRNRKRYVHSSA